MIETTLLPVDAALEEFELEVAHRALVRQIALRAGILGGEVKASYVKLHRVDGMHPLHVTRRGVEWFSSRVEAVAATGLDDAVWVRVNRAGTENWGVTFPKVVVTAVVAVDDAVDGSVAASPAPVAAAPAAPRAPRIVERDYGVCDRCWQARTASGRCGCED